MPTSHVAEGIALAVCGLGNIGSQLVPLLAREPAVGRLELIDRDTYAAENLVSQSIRLQDLNKPKTRVAAGRAQQIAGDRASIRPFQGDLKDVPLGVYRHSAAVFGCLDSRRARIDLAVRCWRAGCWLIDTGVNPDAMLARCSVYAPTDSGPCYLCSVTDWDEVEASYSCDGGRAEVPPSGAPAFLGSAAAVLAMNELRRLISGRLTAEDSGREIVLELGNDHLYCSRHRRHPGCRFDHETLNIKGEVPVSMAIGDALALAPAGEGTPAGLRVEGHSFVRQLQCFNSSCGAGRRTTMRLANRLRRFERRCPACGEPMKPTGFGRSEWLHGPELTGSLRRSSLRRLGLRGGDVIAVGGPSAAACFEVGDHHG